jgi:HEAT repeat protein
MFAGMKLKTTPAPYSGTELTDLKKEVKEMKEAMLLSLLNEESASDRIRAVSYVDEISNPDPKIIHALINTLNSDKNLNVRLAAINSLAKFSGNPLVIDSLIASLSSQTEPMLQIVLINMLTDQKQTRAIEPIKAIISNKQTIQPVKDIAEQGLKKVM